MPDEGPEGREVAAGDCRALLESLEEGIQDILDELAERRRSWSDPEALSARLRELRRPSAKTASQAVGVLLQVASAGAGSHLGHATLSTLPVWWRW